MSAQREDYYQHHHQQHKDIHYQDERKILL